MTEEGTEIVVSASTMARWREELEHLVTEGRDSTSERLRRAREFGDIRENAEYDAAKDAQGLMEARIRQLERMIKRAVVREDGFDADEAGPGIIVTIREEGDDELQSYLLAATAEERIDGIHTVSTSSPMGKALLGLRAGDTTSVSAPGGTFKVEVIGLRPA